jgi:hypothetical protein
MKLKCHQFLDWVVQRLFTIFVFDTVLSLPIDVLKCHMYFCDFSHILKCQQENQNFVPKFAIFQCCNYMFPNSVSRQDLIELLGNDSSNRPLPNKTGLNGFSCQAKMLLLSEDQRVNLQGWFSANVMSQIQMLLIAWDWKSNTIQLIADTDALRWL